jgi:hypothetical protein
MSNNLRRRWFVALPLVLVSTTGLLAAKRADAPLPCEVAARWVATHKNELPKTLAEFESYSSLYQRSMYGKLSGDARIRIWREHLTPYLAPAAGLNADQHALVQRFFNELGVLMPDLKRAHELLEHEHFEKDVEASFDKARMVEIFTLHGFLSTDGNAAPSTTGPSSDPPGFLCDCNTLDQNFDCFNSLCETTGCFIEESGCGMGGMLSCDGECSPGV